MARLTFISGSLKSSKTVEVEDYICSKHGIKIKVDNSWMPVEEYFLTDMTRYRHVVISKI